MNLSLILFLIGILGFVLNRKNIILMLISIEIMLLAITFLILVSSLSFDDILGQTFAIYIIAIAGAESAIGLGILVAYYRLFNLVAGFIISNYSSIKEPLVSLRSKAYLFVMNKFLLANEIRHSTRRYSKGDLNYYPFNISLTGSTSPSSHLMSEERLYCEPSNATQSPTTP
jgi:NADH-ubiquinone oxidoreductase chain 4L